MTTALLHRVPVDRITTQAKQVRFGHTILTILAAVLFSIGWVVAKVFTVLWLGLAWAVTAVKVGWQDARPAPPGEG